MVKPKRARKPKNPSQSDFILVVCEMCGREIIRSDAIRHHIDPSRKTKSPGALAQKDLREKKDLLFLCRSCHGIVHAKLQPKRVAYYDEFGKLKYKKPYVDDDYESSIWR